jgi:HlyD family secretion protein
MTALVQRRGAPSMPSRPRRPREIVLPAEPTWRPATLIGLLILVLFVLAIGAWSVLAPLAGAAIAPGQVRAEGNRRTVQHLEGGIIREFAVREGDAVEPGQTLIRLDDTQAASSTDLLRASIDALRAQLARLQAETEQRDAVRFPADLAARNQESRVVEVIAGQMAIFETRRRSLATQTSVLEQRVQQLEAEIRSRQAQANAHTRQLSLVREELAGAMLLLQRGFERRTRIIALERQVSELEGNRDQELELINRARRAIAEARTQIESLRDERMREATAELRETQNRLVEAEERLRSAADIRRRLDVVAPIGGVVANLRYFTVGAVVRPGEPLLDIVPSQEDLVVEAQVSPTDIDRVHVGQTAEVRFIGLRRRVTPMVLAEVNYVSADIAVNDRTGTTFYRATVRIPHDQLGLLQGAQLQPGMPTEVFIRSDGRSLFTYLFEPIRDSFYRAFRER